MAWREYIGRKVLWHCTSGEQCCSINCGGYLTSTVPKWSRISLCRKVYIKSDVSTDKDPRLRIKAPNELSYVLPFECSHCHKNFTQPTSLHILELKYPHYRKSSISCPAQICHTRFFGISSPKLILSIQIELLAWMISSRSNMRYLYLAHTTNLLLWVWLCYHHLIL